MVFYHLALATATEISAVKQNVLASNGALRHVPSLRLTKISFLVYFGVISDSHCEISLCRCQQLTAPSISTALVTKLLVIEQLLHPVLKSTVSAP